MSFEFIKKSWSSSFFQIIISFRFIKVVVSTQHAGYFFIILCIFSFFPASCFSFIQLLWSHNISIFAYNSMHIPRMMAIKKCVWCKLKKYYDHRQHITLFVVKWTISMMAKTKNAFWRRKITVLCCSYWHQKVLFTVNFS